MGIFDLPFWKSEFIPRIIYAAMMPAAEGLQEALLNQVDIPNRDIALVKLAVGEHVFDESRPISD